MPRKKNRQGGSAPTTSSADLPPATTDPPSPRWKFLLTIAPYVISLAALGVSYLAYSVNKTTAVIANRAYVIVEVNMLTAQSNESGASPGDIVEATILGEPRKVPLQPGTTPLIATKLLNTGNTSLATFTSR